MYASQILGTGSYLPKRKLTNTELETLVDTNDEWILERTGISSRHIASDSEAASDLALQAAQQALEAAHLVAGDIDAIFFATITPDQVMPSAAASLQAKLRFRTVMAVDISAACSGFLYALSLADQFIKTGQYRKVLVVGAEVLSRVTDYQDRTTCILFGDGAGAFILGRADENSRSRFVSQHLLADGNFGDLLTLPAGGSRLPLSQATLDERMHYIQMKGRDVFKAAVRSMSQTCLETLKLGEMSLKDVNWFVPHQANARILESVAEQLNVPREKVVSNIAETGNTSSASIAIAFDQAVRDGRILRNQNVLFAAFGGGLTYGSLLFCY